MFGRKCRYFAIALLICAVLGPPIAHAAWAQDKKPNILVIMGDDVGWENVGAYHQGMMYDTTPNLDQMAKDGMRFTDYYAEASCTAGRANFITGELPIRTGMTTVGQAGSTLGFPDAAPTIVDLNGTNFHVHLDGYDQTPMLTGQGPSNRHEVWYFAQTHLGAVRVDDWKYTFLTQPEGWFGPIVRPNLPILTNLRQDPFERMNWPVDLSKGGSIAYWDQFKHEMWRFQVVQQIIAKNIPSFVEFPPMQAGAGFSTGDLKEKVEAAIAAAKANGD